VGHFFPAQRNFRGGRKSDFFNRIDPKRTSAIYCKIVYTAKLSECSWAVLTNFSPTEKRTSG